MTSETVGAVAKIAQAKALVEQVVEKKNFT
jgi:hypothetical protein